MINLTRLLSTPEAKPYVGRALVQTSTETLSVASVEAEPEATMDAESGPLMEAPERRSTPLEEA